MLGVTRLSLSIASQPWPGQVPRSQLYSRKLGALWRAPLIVRSERYTFGSRFCGLEEKRLGFVVRSQKEDKEGQELDKKTAEEGAFSLQRANAVTGIFMATLVWICLFLWVSVTNSEAGGGRPGRRGPRK